jgi:hypothetical protein
MKTAGTVDFFVKTAGTVDFFGETIGTVYLLSRRQGPYICCEDGRDCICIVKTAGTVYLFWKRQGPYICKFLNLGKPEYASSTSDKPKLYALVGTEEIYICKVHFKIL